MGDSSEAKRVRNLLAARDAALNLNLYLPRLDVLKIAGYGSLAAFITGCGGNNNTTTTGITAKGGTMSLGSYNTDPGSKAGTQAIVDAFTAANGGTKVKLNTVDHGTFQNTISQYLQGTPEDAFTWFSGHRMRFFAAKGLATPIDDVWSAVKSTSTEADVGQTKANVG